MCGFIKPGKSKEELDAIQKAYADALSDFDALIALVRESQPAEEPVKKQEGEPQSSLGNAVQETFKQPSVQQLVDMKEGVEKAIKNNPNSTNVKEIVTRALNATKNLVEYSLDDKKVLQAEGDPDKNLGAVHNEFIAAHKAVMRLTNTLADVALSMGGIGLACVGIGLGLSISGVAATVGGPLFMIGLALCAIDMIIVAARSHGQSADRWRAGYEMSAIKNAVT